MDRPARLSVRERQLATATLTALGVSESTQTAMLSRTHAPIGKGGTNWITKLKPGNKGQLPAYIQNVRNAIMRDGTDESRATAIAIGRVRDWAEGKGNVSAEVKAAAAKAIAEWQRDKAQNAASSKVKETTVTYLNQDLSAEDVANLAVLEAADDAKKSVFCVRDKKKVVPNDKGKCPECGMDLTPAKKVQEAVLAALDRSAL